MKLINEMTPNEIEKEIKEFITTKFDADKPYVFVSYSHKDKTEVMQKVLQWIRQGYNVIMDLDFENHGSEESWVDLVCKRLRSNCCVQVACFRSQHYYYSYASLIELLLLRSTYLESKRCSAKYKEIPIDIIDISEKRELGDDDEFDNYYQNEFKRMKKEVNGDKFFAKKNKEKKMLAEGLETLCSKMRLENNEKRDQKPEEIIANLEESFEDGYRDYYSDVQYLFEQWFKYNDLNGNYKKPDYDASGVFDSHKVYKFKNVEERTTQNIKSEDQVSIELKQPIISMDTNKNEGSGETNEEEALEDGENEEKKKVYSTTGDITYELYGQKYTGNQSEFMIQVFGSVLNKHQDLIDDAIELFTCLSATDYSKDENRTDEMKSYFRVCYTATLGNKQVCIGTAYNIAGKLSLMAKLLSFAGEDCNVLQIEGMELPEIKKKSVISDNKKIGNERCTSTGEEIYVIDGVKKEGTQADMMFDAFERLSQKYPDKINKLTILTSVKQASEVTNAGTTTAKPTYFRICKEYEVLGIKYYVGASYGRKDKIKQIQKMIQLCDESNDFFIYEGEQVSTAVERKSKNFEF